MSFVILFLVEVKKKKHEWLGFFCGVPTECCLAVLSGFWSTPPPLTKPSHLPAHDQRVNMQDVSIGISRVDVSGRCHRHENGWRLVAPRSDVSLALLSPDPDISAAPHCTESQATITNIVQHRGKRPAPVCRSLIKYYVSKETYYSSCIMQKKQKNTKHLKSGCEWRGRVCDSL